MLRVASVALLMASLPAFVQAQRGAGMSSVHGAGAPIHSNVAGRNHPAGVNSHEFARSDTGQFRRRRNSVGPGIFPYFFSDYETVWPEAAYAPEQTNQAPLAPIREEAPAREPAGPLPAQVIEIPNSSKIAETEPLPATVFVLNDGEKLETRRYLLTDRSLSVNVERRQRTIPVKMVDIDATIAANRQRGIDLRIPEDRNEISLRF